MIQLIEQKTVDILDWFRSTPQGQAAVEQLAEGRERERLDQRRAWAAEDRRLEAEQLDRVRAHARAVGPIDSEIVLLEARLQSKRQERAGLEASHRAWMAEAEHRREGVRRQLRATASPLLAAFRREVAEGVASAWAQLDGVVAKAIDGRSRTVWTNRSSVEATAAYLAAAAERLTENGDLPYTPQTDEALRRELDTIRGGIPEIERRPARYGGGEAA
jgi:hypothetical protein